MQFIALSLKQRKGKTIPTINLKTNSWRFNNFFFKNKGDAKLFE